MRDSLVALLFFAGMFGGYYYARKAGYGSLEWMNPAVISEVKKGMGKAQKSGYSESKKGVGHDSKSDRKFRKSTERDREQGRWEGEGVAIDDSESESLPSLYPRKKRTRRHKSTEQQRISLKPVDDNSDEQSTQKNVIAGVPVEDWVLSQKNAISYSYVEIPADLSMRIYLQCMELKKKQLEYLGPEGCQELIARTQASDLRQKLREKTY